ncbi:MAG: HAD family hydrolase [Candidatus Paceibacteria bacterium]
MSHIKAIVFDYDGVIEVGERWLNKAIIALLGIERDLWRETYLKYNHLTNVENMPWADMIAFVSAELGADSEKVKTIRTLVEADRASKKINQPLLEFIKNELRPRGFKIGVLSNNTTDLRPRMQKLGIDSLFDVIVVSGEVGHQKPHAEIFEVLFDRMNVAPSEVVFTDDSPRSLEKAEIIGYTPILFHDTDQFKEALANILAIKNNVA